MRATLSRVALTADLERLAKGALTARDLEATSTP